MPFDLAESFVLAAEQELGARLPESYRTAMVRANGGELEVLEDSWVQYPIADTSDRKRSSRSANHIIKETEVCRGWPRFPGNAVAIAGNGTGDHLVFLRHGVSFQPAVYLWSHEEGSLERVANDFAELESL
ncbi:SMI1/KNR4 family protein [Ideonella sp. 4Y16]|uniref:SMI1/KNR4 family protein n=1 Tax=Ideonella alba TaxID=2824118 RepID=UPI001B37078F|nr:SMI1/KNR4 family protein [Ideonella alba]MBQ0946525.1 SMI1/KNR4 family protein [Ideonella alba]